MWGTPWQPATVPSWTTPQPQATVSWRELGEGGVEGEKVEERGGERRGEVRGEGWKREGRERREGKKGRREKGWED